MPKCRWRLGCLLLQVLFTWLKADPTKPWNDKLSTLQPDSCEYKCKDGGCALLLQVCDGIPDCIDGSDEAVCPKAIGKPGLNVLGYPRLHFHGKFIANPPTVNNIKENYFLKNFSSQFHHGVRGGFAPMGTGNFRFQKVKVSRACYIDGTCTSVWDSLIDKSIISPYDGLPGKMVDIDPLCMWTSIVGLSLKVGDEFTGAMATAPFDRHVKRIFRKKDDDTTNSGTWKSVLKNVKWLKNHSSSKVVQQLRKYSRDMSSTSLAISFVLYGYVSDQHAKNYTHGHFMGTIGLHHPEEAETVYRFSRVMEGSKCQALKSEGDKSQFCHVPFTVDEERKVIIADFSSTMFFTVHWDLDLQTNGLLYLAVPLLSETGPITCNNSFYEVAPLRYWARHWILNTGGIQEFPQAGIDKMKSDWDQVIVSLRYKPLVMIRKDARGRCEAVVVQERQDGVTIGPLGQWHFRTNPGDRSSVTVFANKFGKPLEGLEIRSYLPAGKYREKMEKRIQFECEIFASGFNSPASAFSTAPRGKTDASGLLQLVFKANHFKLEKNKRTQCELDSQLYFFTLHWGKGNLVDWPIIFLLWEHYPYREAPTWYRDVEPIFRRYANLYPVMRPFLNLADYNNVVNNIPTIKFTMQLPLNHSNFMPITRDLSRSKTQMILKWLENPIQGQHLQPTLNNLEQLLQTALYLEMSAIPMYLSPLFTIKSGYNNRIKSLITSIVNQEMLHMTLVANILNALGRRPLINALHQIAQYPSHLPAQIHPDLVLSLKKLSLNHVRSAMMHLEMPSLSVERRCQQLLLKGHHPDNIKHLCHMTSHNKTVGALYRDILHVMVYLEMTAEESIFVGDPSKQMSAAQWYSNENKPIPVVDLNTAKQAIREIVEQGEGSDPCNPMSNRSMLSHYYKLAEVYYGREIRIDDVTCPSEPFNRYRGPEVSACHIHPRMRMTYDCPITYSFRGPYIPFDPDGVWPMIDNPTILKIVRQREVNPSAVEATVTFSEIYTQLLDCIQESFDGNPSKMKDCTGIMFRLYVQGIKVVQTPLKLGGNPDTGPNAGPSFEYVTEKFIKRLPLP